MKRRFDCGLACILVGWLAVIGILDTARAQDSRWASRPGSFVAQPGDPLDWYQKRAMGYRSSLENYWESQRLAQQESARYRVHARFGDHDGYYPGQLKVSTVPFARGNYTYPATFGGCQGYGLGDLCFDFECESLDPIDYHDLCGDRSPIDCLELLRHTGRR